MRPFKIVSVLILTLIFITLNAWDISAQVGINIDNPDASAALHVYSTKQGILFPNLTDAQRDAISSPAAGLFIYNLSENCLQVNEGTPSIPKWECVSFGESEGMLESIGSSCSPMIVSGSYGAGRALTSSETVDVNVDVVESGRYNIWTDTVNGYYFVGSGIFTANGSQSAVLMASGTPLSVGTDAFTLNYGTSNCGFTINVLENGPTGGNCGGQTTVVDVVSPWTGQIWMDRNIGASRVATSSTDYQAYGCLYQWGRPADGHELINWTSSTSGTPINGTTYVHSPTDIPGHGDFIIHDGGVWDWRVDPNNNLWQGVNGINNPCPAGYRVPTYSEIIAEENNFSPNTGIGAYNSFMKLTIMGYRWRDGTFIGTGTSDSYYWTTTKLSTEVRIVNLHISPTFAGYTTLYRYQGNAVRCIKD